MSKLAEEVVQSTTAKRPPVEVHILDGFGHVDKDEVVVSPNQEVVWFNDSKQLAQIVFKNEPEGTPFAESFVAYPGKNTHSGLPREHAHGKKRYKYRVNQNDPGVIIDK